MQKNNNDWQELSGYFLLSNPYLGDQNFERAVIYIIDHDQSSGAMGLIVNKFSDSRASDILNISLNSQKLFKGGPVGLDMLFVMHQRKDLFPHSQAIGDNLFLTGNLDLIQDCLDLKLISSAEMKFIMGYTGWSAGQLEEEINENAWIVLKGNTNLAMIQELEGNNYWKSILQKNGHYFSSIANAPSKPWLN